MLGCKLVQMEGSSYMALNETSQSTELLLRSIDGVRSKRSGAQIEDRLRARDPRRRAAPRARDCRRRRSRPPIAASRRVVVDAYAQLAAEGYLSVRQGAPPRVSTAAVLAPPTPADGVQSRAGGAV